MEESLQLYNNGRVLAVLFFAIALTIGCTPPEEPTGSISGQVTFKGKAVDNCKVDFYDRAGRQSRAGSAREDGLYEVKDVKFTDYEVAVYQLTDPHSAGDTPFDSRIPEKYRSFKTSGITVSVNSADNVVLNIEME